MALTSIPLSPSVRDRLKTYGAMGDTYNAILTRMMDQIELDRFVATLREQAAEADRTDTWVELADIDWDE